MDLQPLDDLDQTAVDDRQAYLAERMQEAIPAARLSQGVLNDLLLKLAAPTLVAFDDGVDRVRRSSTLKAIEADPSLADDETVDAVLSNYGIVRREGSPATGQAIVVLDKLAPSNVAAGTVFAAASQTFVTLRSFAGRVDSASVLTETDRLITSLGGGTYGYAIDLVAETVGRSGEIRRNTRLEPNVSLPNVVLVYARDDFRGGVDADDNETLLQRLREGVAPRDLSSQTSISALLRLGGVLPVDTHVSVIGYSAPEQQRYHGLFPIAGGARLDVYLRTALLPLQIRLEKAATLLSHGTAGSTWQFSIDRDEAPGFYDVVQISDLDDVDSSTGRDISEEIRSLDVADPPGQYVPDLETGVEAAYTRYQTGIFRFLDPTTAPDVALGTSRTYAVGVRVMPQIEEAQTILSSASNRPGGGDVVAKAAISCDVRVQFVVRRRASEDDPDVEAIQAAVAAAVNEQGFVGRLPASALAAVVHGFLTGSQALGRIDLRGVIRRPDGDKIYLRSDFCLEVPEQPTAMVSPRTVVFVLDPANIGVSVEASNSPAI